VRLWRERKFNSGKSDQAKTGEKGASTGDGKEAEVNEDWLVLQSIMAVEILSADAGDEDFVPPKYNYTLKTWQP